VDNSLGMLSTIVTINNSAPGGVRGVDYTSGSTATSFTPACALKTDASHRTGTVMCYI
jgi:hypothetical protein